MPVTLTGFARDITAPRLLLCNIHRFFYKYVGTLSLFISIIDLFRTLRHLSNQKSRKDRFIY